MNIIFNIQDKTMDRNIQDVVALEKFDRTIKALQFAGFFLKAFTGALYFTKRHNPS